jgi:hypothetical protein
LTTGLEFVAETLAPKLAGAPTHRWQTIILTPEMSTEAKQSASRLNAMGSLYWFGKVVLGHQRFSPNLHAYMCSRLEQESLRLSLEMPRDHFKTSVASVCAPMWWALPFNEDDEEMMRILGYGDAWIRWMHRAHNSSTRTMIASETQLNARKIGVKIAGHYESNRFFRLLFPEILPRKIDRWNQDSMTHNRVNGQYHGEGTYDLIGVKGALQSRHYDRQVIDDAVGEKAIASDLVMEGTIGWIQKLPGAFDSDPTDPTRMADQLFIGNRWSNRDVGTWLRKHVVDMKFETHDAEGGCCALHPAGQPIFPEEFTMEKLAEIRSIFGSYFYAAQYRNNPTDPEAVRFKSSWLRHYSLNPFSGESNISIANSQQLNDLPTPQEVIDRNEKEELSGAIPQRLKIAIHHETQDGEAIEDIRAGMLERVAILDPNHSEERGRSRHAIVVLGMYFNPPAPRRIYLLDCWAGATSFDEMIARLIGMQAGTKFGLGLALKWKVHHIYLESEVAGQQGWLRFFQDRVRNMGPAASFTVRPLKTDRTAGGKDKRIVGMEPFYENGMFWVPRIGEAVNFFQQEYDQYPNGSTKDILDVIGYAPQTWGPGSQVNTRSMVSEELNRRKLMIQSMGVAGY